MELVWSDDLLEEAGQTRDRVAARLRGLGVPGELELTGAAGTPGAVTKGDVDLHLRVPEEEFADAVRTLRSTYVVGSPHAWAGTLAVFDVPGARPTGLAVTPVGSEHDRRFVDVWRRLRADPELLAEHNRLKRATWGTSGYEDGKSDFFTFVAEVVRCTMTTTDQDGRVVRVERQVAAGADLLFELVADPQEQPRWDGNDNLAEAPDGQRVRGVGATFVMRLTNGQDRENHVVEFEEGRRIAWRPAEPGQPPPGHLWRWELEPVDDSHTLVVHTYDWSALTDEKRLVRARATTVRSLEASLDRLAELAEQGGQRGPSAGGDGQAR